MTSDALKTLFHPFETGLLDLPVPAAKVLFHGAEPGIRLPNGFSSTTTCVQGFRPAFRALEGAGQTVHPRTPDAAFDATLILCGRHRGQNELRIADAIEHVAEGGLLVVAGGKDDGIQSLRKRVSKIVELGGHAPKHHGEAFWFWRPADSSPAVEALRDGNEPRLIDGRFHTAPGMFSFDRIDAGSKLLAENLPTDLKGAVADFCAGWGYLSAEALARNPGVASLDLYEADYESVEAARRNVVAAIPIGFFWHDLLAEPVARRYDAILMNPPFHTGRAAEPAIGQGMIRAAAAALKPGGRLLLVANRQLPYESLLAASFASAREIASDRAFKVFAAKR